MYKGMLYSPAGRGFAPYHLTYLSNYIWMANAWLKDRTNPKTLKPFTAEPSVHGEASGAIAPSGSRLHQGKIRRESNVVSLHKRDLLSEKLENYSEFGSIGDAANDVLASEVL